LETYHLILSQVIHDEVDRKTTFGFSVAKSSSYWQKFVASRFKRLKQILRKIHFSNALDTSR